MRIFKICIISILLVLFVEEASAQLSLLIRDEQKGNFLYTNVGFDNSIVTSGLGYKKGFHLNFFDRRIIVGGNVSFPMFEFDINDFAMRLGAGIEVYETQNFSIPIEVNITLKGIENGTFDGNSIGTEVGIIPGYYKNTWLVAGEFFWNQQWLTYIAHTNYYKTYFFEAKDGWLITSASNIRLGIRTGIIILKDFEILFRAGYQQRGKLDDKLPPYYAILSLGTSF